MDVLLRLRPQAAHGFSGVGAVFAREYRGILQMEYRGIGQRIPEDSDPTIPLKKAETGWVDIGALLAFPGERKHQRFLRALASGQAQETQDSCVICKKTRMDKSKIQKDVLNTIPLHSFA